MKDSGSEKRRKHGWIAFVAIGIVLVATSWVLTQVTKSDPESSGRSAETASTTEATAVVDIATQEDVDVGLSAGLDSHLTPEEASGIALDYHALPGRNVPSTRQVKVLSVELKQLLGFQHLNAGDPKGKLGPSGERRVWEVILDAPFHRPVSGGTISSSTTHYTVDDSTQAVVSFGTGAM